MKKYLLILISAILVLFFSSQSWSTTVSVYAESGYSETKFVVNLYADFNTSTQGEGLLSASIKFSYPISKLQNPLASKNERVWYFGTLLDRFPYTEPVPDGSGEIIMTLGKLDQDNPIEGIGGNRIHLGRITFDRIPLALLPTQTDMSLDVGRPNPYVNFASSTGQNLDEAVTFYISPVVSYTTLNMRNVIRILSLLSGFSTDVPVRWTELDINNDRIVNTAEAIFLFQEIAE